MDALAAIAMRTQRIRIGPLVTPVPRRHIGKLAREVLTLDQLSNGRVTFGVGAGFPALPDYGAFGDETDLKVRAAALDEALPLLSALWSGQPVKHAGTHYRVDCAGMRGLVQQPRVPVWVAAAWPANKPLVRAAQWDGVVPVAKMGLEIEPAELCAVVDIIKAHRSSTAPFDVIRFGQSKDARDTALVGACAEVGATWWVEWIYTRGSSLEATRARVRAGPPRI